MQNSHSLVLEIFRQDNALSMSIFEQNELASTIRQYTQLQVAFNEIHKLCQEIVSILNKAVKLGTQDTDLISGLKKTGQLLWDHLLTRNVKDKLKSTTLKDLVLAIDEELIYIPWELLYDGYDFLCLKFNLGRLVRTKQKQSPSPQYRSLSTKPRMLILANPTSDLKSAYLEGLDIKNQFDKKRDKLSIDFKSTYIDTLYVKKNFRDYDIVHFAGHAEFDMLEPNNTGWLLSDGRFTTQDILTLGESISLPTLVFSNACYSAKTSTDIEYQEKNYSLASAFLFSGVRHYIGSIRKIEDPQSLTFAQEFYTQLINGKSIGECVRLSRIKLIKECGLSSIYWTGYLLYGDPNFILFQGKSKPLLPKFKKDISLYKKSTLKLALGVAIISICIYLYMWLPSINPTTYVLFAQSKKLFLKGNNQEVISLGSQLIKKDPLFLTIYPLVADTYQRIGDKQNALKYYFEYIISSEKRKDKKHLSSAYRGMGWIYHLQGEYPKAFDFYEKAINLSREIKDRLNEARSMERLAVWYIDKADYDKALELLMKSSAINRERLHILEHRYGLACDYFDIGLVFINKDDLVSAKEFYNKSKTLFENLRLKHELSDCYFNLGEISLYEKEYQKALDYYQKGLNLDQRLGNLANIASDYNMLGELCLEMNNLTEAEKFFKQSISVCKQINAVLELGSAYYNLGLLYKKQGQKDKAREYLKEAQEIYRPIDTPDYQDIKIELLDLD